MKLVEKYYNKFRKHRRDEIKRIVRSEIIINSMKEYALQSADILVNKEEDRKEKIIVSLTTFGKRINWVYLAIESIAQQTLKPDKVILWLSEDDFNDDKLPITIKRLKERGLTVCYRKDIGPHTKGIYAFQEYPNDIIITVDDDIIYPIALIENLYNTYIENPKTICCNVAKKIEKNNKGSIIPYRNWKHSNRFRETRKDLVPLGVNGVLYFPNCLDREVFNLEIMKNLCPIADDLWFKAMALLKNTKVTVTGSYPQFTNNFIPLESSFMAALAVENLLNNKNDSQFKAILQKYNIKI